jgi:group I intron endonuclease
VEQKIYSLYRITNLINNKNYIGQTVAPKQRWYDHKKVAKNNPNQIVHHAMIKHGINNFEFVIIASCKSLEDANQLETSLVSQYESHVSTGKGYNMTLGGMNAPKTEEWKQKVSQTLMGHEVSKESRDKISKGNTGKIRSDDFKKNVGDFWRGKERTEEHKENLSKSLTGNKLSEETKEKLSKIRKGTKLSEETKEKIRNAISGRTTVHKGRTWKIIDGKRVWIDK